MPGTVTFHFENFALDTGRGVLLRDGEEVPLRRQSYEVLVYLVANVGRLVTREELLEALWPGKVVTDASITQCLVDIRAALEDSAHEKIRTLTRRGYRFELPVTEVEESDPSPPSRHDSKSAARAALGRWGWFLATAAAIVALATWWIGSQSEPPAPPLESRATADALIIAAMPFENLSPGVQDQRFLDGFHDVLLTELGRYPDLQLIARWSIEALGVEVQNPEQLREVLDADLALTGNVARDAERILFTFQLHDTRSGQQAWAETFDRPFNADELISLQRNVAEEVAREAVHVVKGNGELAAPTSGSFPATGNLEAYGHYLNGLAHARRIEAGEHTESLLEAGRNEFHAAMAADPQWAPPYAALGRILHFMASSSTVPDAWRESWQMIDRALALDPDYAPALASLGYLEFRWRRDYAAAERAYLRALAAGEPMAEWGLAILYTTLGYMDAALTHFRAAIASDPLNPVIRGQYAWRLGCDGQWDLAAKTLTEVLQLENHPAVQRHLAYAEIRAGEVERGVARWQQHEEDQTVWDGFLELALGDDDAARAELGRRLTVEPLPPPYTAELALELGEVEQALDLLEQRAANDPDSLRHMMCERSVRDLEGHPRFDQLLADLGLRGPGVPSPPF